MLPHNGRARCVQDARGRVAQLRPDAATERWWRVSAALRPTGLATAPAGGERHRPLRPSRDGGARRRGAWPAAGVRGAIRVVTPTPPQPAAARGCPAQRGLHAEGSGKGAAPAPHPSPGSTVTARTRPSPGMCAECGWEAATLIHRAGADRSPPRRAATGRDSIDGRCAARRAARSAVRRWGTMLIARPRPLPSATAAGGTGTGARLKVLEQRAMPAPLVMVGDAAGRARSKALVSCGNQHGARLRHGGHVGIRCVVQAVAPTPRSAPLSALRPHALLLSRRTHSTRRCTRPRPRR